MFPVSIFYLSFFVTFLSLPFVLNDCFDVFKFFTLFIIDEVAFNLLIFLA